jgi:hypothetical protein
MPAAPENHPATFTARRLPEIVWNGRHLSSIVQAPKWSSIIYSPIRPAIEKH